MDNSLIKTKDLTNYLATAMYVGSTIIIIPNLSDASFILIPNITIPLIIWLLNKDKNEAINKHGINILNFQITLSILILLIICLSATTFFLVFTIPLAVVFIYALKIANLILAIISGVKAYKSDFYELPFKYNFIKSK